MNNELRAAIAALAHMVRQLQSDGNIQVMSRCCAARTVCEALVGAEEFQRWVDWQAPHHIMVNTALAGGSPPEHV